MSHCFQCYLKDMKPLDPSLNEIKTNLYTNLCEGHAWPTWCVNSLFSLQDLIGLKSLDLSLNVISTVGSSLDPAISLMKLNLRQHSNSTINHRMDTVIWKTILVFTSFPWLKLTVCCFDLQWQLPDDAALHSVQISQPALDTWPEALSTQIALFLILYF